MSGSRAVVVGRLLRGWPVDVVVGAVAAFLIWAFTLGWFLPPTEEFTVVGVAVEGVAMIALWAFAIRKVRRVRARRRIAREGE